MNVTGSPVKHTVQPGTAPVAYGDGLVAACEGKTANFVVDGKGKRGDLVVHVDGRIDVAVPPCDLIGASIMTLWK